MSWTAYRYQPGHQGADPEEMTKHHVPPKKRRRCRPFILNITRSIHDAYHHAIGTPRTYEEACQIMWDRFWKPPEGQSDSRVH
jgi:hypothetical protein